MPRGIDSGFIVEAREHSPTENQLMEDVNGWVLLGSFLLVDYLVIGSCVIGLEFKIKWILEYIQLENKVIFACLWDERMLELVIMYRRQSKRQFLLNGFLEYVVQPVWFMGSCYTANRVGMGPTLHF